MESMSVSGDQVFVSTWPSETAAISTSGLRTVDQGCPTGLPSASQPPGYTGPSASRQAMAAVIGDLPQPRGRESTPRWMIRLQVTGSIS